MANQDVEVICATRECRVAETGKCIEGLDLGTCPHFGRAAESDESSGDTATGAVSPLLSSLSAARPKCGHVPRSKPSMHLPVSATRHSRVAHMTSTSWLAILLLSCKQHQQSLAIEMGS